ncbi:hypothetical protein GCM10023201_51080 [Actinomycetospora corticicola]|uniref:Uncharacterized protein n=1 Tax=Actinomycetospora corticicola TaxID=663602 RepID=A0A7Y9J6Q8_9PSEU|nr:hypothetical protein [Actinomycetospora corticicola]NYD37627.1 hypothetical protein [Actinomycetospora corticicola]
MAVAHDLLAGRVAELGLVRASELPARGARPAASHTRPTAVPTSGPASPEPEPAPPPEPAHDPEQALLPVPGALAGLLPWGGLRRGSTVSVHGSTALLLALVARASRAGSWCALVGLPGVGMAAAHEAGLDLARTALVPRPGPRPSTVVAALVDGVDVVVLGGASAWRAGDRQRLAARVRQKGAVLVPVGAWPGADVELHASGGTWSGLLGDGAGRLRSRRVHLRCAARGRARDLRSDVLLPGPEGGCAPAPDEAVGPLEVDIAPARTG